MSGLNTAVLLLHLWDQFTGAPEIEIVPRYSSDGELSLEDDERVIAAAPFTRISAQAGPDAVDWFGAGEVLVTDRRVAYSLKRPVVMEGVEATELHVGHLRYLSLTSVAYGWPKVMKGLLVFQAPPTNKSDRSVRVELPADADIEQLAVSVCEEVAAYRLASLDLLKSAYARSFDRDLAVHAVESLQLAANGLIDWSPLVDETGFEALFTDSALPSYQRAASYEAVASELDRLDAL